VSLTRRELLDSAGASALAASGIYDLVDRFVRAPSRPSSPVPAHLPEQHILQALRIVVDDGVEVFLPPLHSQVVTAAVRIDAGPGSLAAARAELERQLRRLDERFPSTPGGLGVTVAWGLPYFARLVPAQAQRHLPVDLRASRARGRAVRALEPTRRFPSDPEDVILEHNDVAVLLRSDSLNHILEAASALFGDAAGAFQVTSVRRGFAGGGFDGGRGLPKQMAIAARLPGAERIPDRAELFLGFTSTQKQASGLERISNLETLGYADLGPGGYFLHGTHMHLSHLEEDLEAWYQRLDERQRVEATFSPGLEVAPGTLTVAQGPADIQSRTAVVEGYHRYRRIGHSGSIQTASRLGGEVRGPDGVLYPRGALIPHRADFNTLDNPFAWSADPVADRMRPRPAAGLHFVVFNPTGDDFSRNRLAMDGVLPGGPALPLPPGSAGQGFNRVLRTTHRQNFLVPPRAHRSFPLSELPA
jgi:hypothetical protein